MILAAGHIKTKKRLEYVLVEAATMTVADRLTVKEKVDQTNGSVVRHIKLTSLGGRLVAVCCRASQYIDILQVTGNRLSTASQNRAVDVSGDKDYKCIASICQHASKKNVFLLGGNYWLKQLDLAIN